MASGNVVDVLVRLKGARQFASESAQTSKAIKTTGDEVQKTDKKMRISHSGMAAWAAGAAAVGGAAALIKSSVKSTEDFTKSTIGLTRVTGMDAKQASIWVEMAKVRGIEAKDLQTGFKGLSKNMVGAAKGGKTQIKQFKDLGVSMKDIKEGNTESVLMQVSEGLHNTTNAAAKTSAVTTLFSKAGLKLFGILDQGKSGLTEMMGEYEKYGPTVDEKGVTSTKALIKQQQITQMMWDKMKYKIGSEVIPVLVQLGTKLLKVIERLDKIFGDGNGVIVMLGALAAAFTISPIIELTTAALHAFGLAASANVVGLVILAVVALGVAFYLLFTHLKQVWKWIKANWPYLVGILGGPFGVAAIVIKLFWKQIKDGVNAAIKWIRNAWNNFLEFFRSLPGKLASLGGSLWGWIKKGLQGTLQWVVNLWNATFGHIFGGIDLGGKKKKPTVSGGAYAGPSSGGRGKGGTSALGIKGMQAGGTVTRAGMALVGEGGPELLALPRAASVQPLTVDDRRSLDPAINPPQSIITKVFLDRRQIAEAVGLHTADKLARR